MEDHPFQKIDRSQGLFVLGLSITLRDTASLTKYCLYIFPHRTLLKRLVSTENIIKSMGDRETGMNAEVLFREFLAIELGVVAWYECILFEYI